MSKLIKAIVTLVVILILAAGAYVYTVFNGKNTFAGAEKRMMYVSKGQTWDQVVDSLESNGIVRSRQWFELAVKLLNMGKQTHVGKYQFTSGVSNLELYNLLRTGEGIVPISVTLKEGRRAVVFARAFHRMVGIDTVRFMNLVQDGSFARSLGVNAGALEGYLSPNTYFFNWQTEEEEIVKRLVHQTLSQFNDSLRARANEMKLSIHQVLTLASIIEGEAFLDDERAAISGVYHNRLRRGMKLEADPTIQFILPDGPRRVLYRDLQIRNPYNTYLHYGLPPGPVSNPRRASILAALYPAKHEYIFFVANGRGGHWFSRNYADHLSYVRKFRRERAEQLRTQGVG